MSKYYIYCPTCGVIATKNNLNSALKTLELKNTAHENKLLVINAETGVIEGQAVTT